MKKYNTLYLVSFLLLACNGQTVMAQDVTPATPTTGSEENTSATLAPLETVSVPLPSGTNGANGERQTYLSAGEPSPWAGVLLNPAAVAFIVSQYESQYDLATAALERQRDSDWNRLQLEVGRLTLRIETLQEEHNIIVTGLNRDIENLVEIHQNYVEEKTGGFWNSDFGRVLEYVLIIVGVGAVGVAVGYMAGSL